MAATNVPPDPASSPPTGTSSPPSEQAAAASSATVAARAEARGVRIMGSPRARGLSSDRLSPEGDRTRSRRRSGGTRPGPPGGPGRAVAPPVGAAAVGRRGRRGQLDPERRADTDLGADREAPAHRLDQAAGERQTDAGAVDAALGGVEPLERLEQPIEVLG